MHVGHCRGAVVGDALANLLAKAGWDVTKEYYINDAGAQVRRWRWRPTGATCRRCWRRAAEPRQRVRRPIRPEVARRACNMAATTSCRSARRWRPSTAPALAPADGSVPAGAAGWRRCATSPSTRMMVAIREDLAMLGVEQDVFVSERALVRAGKLEQAEQVLQRPRPDLSRRAGTAQGQDAGRLGAARADAVPRHAIRRRGRPAAAQVRRQRHLFRQRHRQPPAQDRTRLRRAGACLGRRPWRLCQAHAGRGRRAVRRQRVPLDVVLVQIVTC